MAGQSMSPSRPTAGQCRVATALGLNELSLDVGPPSTRKPRRTEDTPNAGPSLQKENLVMPDGHIAT